MRALLIVTMLVLAGGRAWAQQLEPPRPRQGYYFTAGYGVLATQADEKGQAQGPWVGTSLTLRVGQLVTRRFGLGLEFDSGATRGDGQQGTLAGLALEGNFALTRALVARGSVGFGILALQVRDQPDAKLRGTSGGSYALALAYDWFPRKDLRSGGFCLTPVLEARVLPGTKVTGVAATLGVELGYYTGLPNEQLELAPGEGWR